MGDGWTKNEIEVLDCNSIAWDLGVYSRALARRRLGIPMGSYAAAEIWSVSSVKVILTAAGPFYPWHFGRWMESIYFSAGYHRFLLQTMNNLLLSPTLVPIQVGGG